MKPLSALADCAGKWLGTNRLHDPHTKAPDDSPSGLAVVPVLDSRFLRIDYSWAYQGKPQEGSLLIGADPGGDKVTAHWMDTWHMGHQVLLCHGSAGAGGKIELRGSYAAPPGPDWGWSIEIAPVSGQSLHMVMMNIDPDGRSETAVEASFTQVTAPMVAEIGQIAVTVADVAKSLSFYRDVLGLRFLFSPGPQLAFLSAGSVRIMLSHPEGAGAVSGNSILYFKVTDIERVYQTIVNRGATGERAPQLTARMPDHALWMGFLRDPDGNLVGLMEEKRPHP